MEQQPGRTKRLVAALRRMDSGERLLMLIRAVRRHLPGDHNYGDPLSIAGDEAPHVIGRGIAAMANERPSALRELGMGALAVTTVLRGEPIRPAVGVPADATVCPLLVRYRIEGQSGYLSDDDVPRSPAEIAAVRGLVVEVHLLSPVPPAG